MMLDDAKQNINLCSYCWLPLLRVGIGSSPNLPADAGTAYSDEIQIQC